MVRAFNNRKQIGHFKANRFETEQNIRFFIYIVNLHRVDVDFTDFAKSKVRIVG